MYSSYTSFGVHRFSLWWRSPNECAAFLVPLVPFIWWLQSLAATKNRALVWGLVAGELVLGTMIAITFSRGAAIAVFAILTAKSILDIMSGASRCALIKGNVTRILLWLTVAFSVGLPRRFDPSFLLQDGSALNRLSVWKGAVQLAGCELWAGWHPINPAWLYSNCIQELEDTAKFSTLLNPVLECFVRYGFIIGVLLVTAITVITILPFAQDKRPIAPSLFGASGLCCIAWIVCNQFSYFVDEPPLWVAPTLAFIAITSSIIRYYSVRRFVYACVFGLIVGGTLSITLALFAVREASVLPYRLSKYSSNCVAFDRLQEDSIPLFEVTILPDSNTLGPTPGRYVRKLLDSDARIGRALMAVKPLSDPEGSLVTSNMIVALGWRASEIRRIRNRNTPKFLFFPKLERRATLPDHTTILLPSIDETHQNWQIQAWYSDSVPITFVASTGTDAREAWAETMKQLVDQSFLH